MKTLIIIFISVFASCNLFSQGINYELKSTEIFKEKSKDKFIDIKLIGNDDDFYYYDLLPRYDYFGSAGNNAFHLIGKLGKNSPSFTRKKIVLESKDDALGVKGVYYLNNKLIMLREIMNKYTNRTKLVAQGINKKNLAVYSELKTLFEISLDSCERYNHADYNISISADGSKLMIFYSLLDKNYYPFRFGVRVYDEHLELLWSNNSIKPNVKKGMFEFKNFKVSNSGNVYVLGKISSIAEQNYLEGGDGFLKLSLGEFYFIQHPGFRFQIYEFSKSNKPYNCIDLSIPARAIRDINYSITKDDNIIAYGVFSEKGKISVLGSFTLGLDFIGKKVKNVDIKSFNSSLYSQGFSKSELRKYFNRVEDGQEWDPNNYKIGEIKTRANGDKYFIAEQWLESKATVRSTEYTMYYYRDVFVVNLNKNNIIRSNYKISKRQYTSLVINRSSCVNFESNGKLYFAFNNIFRKVGGEMKYDKVYLVSLDDKGSQKKIDLISDIGGKTPLILPFSQVKSGSNSVIYANLAMKSCMYSFSKLILK